MTYSLRRRLLGWLLISTAVLGMLALLDTLAEARRTAQGVSDRVLAGSAMAIAERVTVNAGGGLDVDIPYSALEMLTSTAQDRVFYRVDAPGGFLTGYEDLPMVAVPGQEIAFADKTFTGAGVRIATLSRAVSTGDGSIAFTVTVAESTLAREALARSILLRSALRLAGMIAGAAGIVWVSVTLALRPLDRLGLAIAQRSPDDLRPLREATPHEVQGLVEAVNSFMGRLDTALGALRNFTGNASHQLRTPLAVVRTQLALATRSNDPAQAAIAADKADAALARAERVLAQLLVLARVDAAAGQALDRDFDLAALARSLTAEMVPQAAQAGIDLGYDGPFSAMLRAEPVLVSEALRNLLDNAIAYAGRGAAVTVRVSTGEGSVRLQVEDDGPGLPEARIAALSQRKGAALTETAQGGYGLGLSIVQEIAGLFGADTRIARTSPAGGLCVTMQFPADHPAR